MKLLARNPDKVTKILETLFEEGEVSKHQENITVVKGGAKDEEALVELLTGSDTVLSFLGMVEPPTWIVAPGVEAIIKALKKVAESKSFMFLLNHRSQFHFHRWWQCSQADLNVCHGYWRLQGPDEGL